MFYRRFMDGIPVYLARHYWWAYLWRLGVWFFDHQPIINAILFGQYRNLMETSLRFIGNQPAGRILQLTCVYGAFTPRLVKQLRGRRLHLADVAPIQLQLAHSKTNDPACLELARMDAECLGYQDNVFDRAIIFFLFHELPDDVRARAMKECMRVLAPGGRLLVTEYGPLPGRHPLYRFLPSRWLIKRLEPFLDGFWHEDLSAQLSRQAAVFGKQICAIEQQDFFSGFYRVTEFEVREQPSRNS